MKSFDFILKLFLKTIFALFITNCSLDSRIDFDNKIFARFGGNVFTRPAPLTAKEIHLDIGTMVGKLVVLQGRVVDVGSFGTYLILQDNTANMLVFLSELQMSEEDSKTLLNKNVRIFGSPERGGKLGLPMLVAKSISLKK